MSNSGQVALTVVGAIIGAYTGLGWIGVIYGAQIGLLAGQMLFPTQLPGQYGPRLEDLLTTSAQLGVPVPIIYGTIAVPGTVIFLSCVEEVVSSEEVGGKGGPTQTVTTYTYFQTIAVGLCEGPINGLLRIWENGELKYDVRPQLPDESVDEYAERIEMSSEYGAGMTVYLGDEVQQADPTLEVTMGVGEVPAFRGLAYVVFPNRQLRDEQARRHPQFRFEIWTGESEQEVLPPIELTGSLDGYQSTQLVADWPRNRYYTVDLVGTQGIRVFDVMTNQELDQVLLADLIVPPYIIFTGMAVGPDGMLYLNGFVGLNALNVTVIDPTTWQVETSVELAGAPSVLRHMTIVRWVGSLETIDYLWDAGLFSYFTFRRANPVGIATIVHSHPGLEGRVCGGYRNGTTTYAYGVTWEALGSGSGPGINVFLLTIDEQFTPLLLPVPVPSLTQIATIPFSALDPACTRIIRLTGLIFDETDRTLIFGCDGYGPASGGGAKLYECFFKFDPETNAIVWRSADLIIENSDQYSHTSRLRGGTYAVAQAFQEIALIDTRTGSHEIIEIDEPPNGFTGQSLYDSAHGTVITYVIGDGPWVIFLDRRLPGDVSVASIISDVSTRCGLAAEEVDVADLTDREVKGYAITRPSPGRGIIEPLRQVAYFDAVESDGRLKFPARGGAIALTLSEEDLGAHYAEEERPALVTTQKSQDVELPKRIRIQYIAESRDYDTGDAPSPSRITSAAVNEVDIQVPVSISDDHAMQAAEILWSDAWGSRWTHQITLDVSALALEPTDVIAIPVDGRQYRARIVSIEDAAGFLRKLTLMRDDDGRYTSTAVADPPQRPPVRIIAYSASALLLLDLPPLRDEDDNAGIYAVAYPVNPARTWTGAVVYRSADSGISFTQIGSIVTAGIVGRLVNELPAGISTTWDNENVIDVEMISGTLESRTEDAVISGANAAAIGAHGRWEIVQYLNATQISATRWQLSGLLRGRRATEHHIGTSAVDDLFVVISAGGMVRFPLQLAEIGLTRIYRPVTLGTSVSEASSVSFIGSGEALRPFSPVHIHGTRSGGDLIIEWTRRGRFGQELRSGTDIPLSEETEEYEVDILVPGASPDTALRTLETSITTVTYTAAEQAADGFVGDDPIMVRVYQISASVGRGTPGEATL
jgi:hypothetical protein